VGVLATTLINSIFYLLSLGWCAKFFMLPRPVANNVILLGASLYMLILAKDYFDDQVSVYTFFTIAIMMVYAYLLCTIDRNLRRIIG